MSTTPTTLNQKRNVLLILVDQERMPFNTPAIDWAGGELPGHRWLLDHGVSFPESCVISGS